MPTSLREVGNTYPCGSYFGKQLPEWWRLKSCIVGCDIVCWVRYQSLGGLCWTHLQIWSPHGVTTQRMATRGSYFVQDCRK